MSHPDPTREYRKDEHPYEREPVGAHMKALVKAKTKKRVAHNKGKTQFTTYTGSGPMKGKRMKTDVYF